MSKRYTQQPQIQAQAQPQSQSQLYTIPMTYGKETFLMVVKPGYATFNDANHAKNFAKYLHRAGREQPNDLTFLNQRWLDDGDKTSADYRTSAGKLSLDNCIEAFSRQYDRLVNDLCYFIPQEPTNRLPSDDHMWLMYNTLCDEMGIDVMRDVIISHHDQAGGAHIHRVYDQGKLSAYEAITRQLGNGNVTQR